MDDYLKTAPCGYFVFQENGFLVEANDTFCKLLQYSANELQGQPIEKFLTLSSRIFYQTHFFPLLKMQEHSEEIFITLLKKDKSSLPALVNAVVQLRENTPYYACAFIVVNQRKKFEDELLAAKKNAEIALQENVVLQGLRDELLRQSELLEQQFRVSHQQNEELRQLTRAVSHELQEPVRKIAVFSQLLMTPPGKIDMNSTLTRLQKAMEQLRLVVSGLQRFLWLQEVKMVREEVNLEAIIVAVRDKLMVELNTTLDLYLGELPIVPGDAKQLEILCYELLSNVIKFRKNDQQAHLSVNGTTIKKNSFRELNRYAYEDYVKIDFKDNGKGFDPAFKSQVLELFHRLAVSHGAGVGLALCKKIVDNHHGFIEVLPKEGEGVIVSVLLPAIGSGHQSPYVSV